MLAYGLQQTTPALCHRHARQANQQNAVRREILPKDQLSKTLVPGNENGPVGVGRRQHLIVGAVRLDFSHVEDFMAFVA